MRKTSHLWFATAGLIAMVGGVLVVTEALPAIADTAARQGHPRVLHLVTETEQFSVINVGDQGPALGLGDEVISSDRVLRDGQRVGRSGTELTVVGTSPGVLTTDVLTTIDLPEGQLVLQGIVDGPTGPPTTPLTATLAVTGGTGAFSRVTGVAEIVDRPGGTEELTVRLSD
jgi:allene oxide cyclase-like protein